MRLCYIVPNEDEPIQTKMNFDTDDVTYLEWLQHMMDSNPDTNFFFVVDSTDIWEASPDEEKKAQCKTPLNLRNPHINLCILESGHDGSHETYGYWNSVKYGPGHI